MFEILFGIAIIVFASKVAPAVARRVGQGTDSKVGRRLEELEERATTTEDRLLDLSAGTHERFVDVEERLDFTERVLQQQRHREGLPGGSKEP
jgi:hypothetical protein